MYYLLEDLILVENGIFRLRISIFCVRADVQTDKILQGCQSVNI